MLLTLLSFTLAAPAPEAVTDLAKSPPPLVMVATADKEGRPYVRALTTRYVPTTRTVETNDGGKTQKRLETVVVPVTEEHRVYLDDKDAAVYDTDGKKIDPRDLPKLTGEVAVLVSADGKEFPPLYRKLAREGTLIIVHPQLAFLRPGGPAKAPPEATRK